MIDESLLVAPGDALHERRILHSRHPSAAELTLATAIKRRAEELTTIAWSWAALVKLEIEPEDIFHNTAYKRGDSDMIIESARRGVYIGFPLLQVWEMAFDERNAPIRGVKPFPTW